MILLLLLILLKEGGPSSLLAPYLYYFQLFIGMHFFLFLEKFLNFLQWNYSTYYIVVCSIVATEEATQLLLLTQIELLAAISTLVLLHSFCKCGFLFGELPKKFGA